MYENTAGNGCDDPTCCRVCAYVCTWAPPNGNGRGACTEPFDSRHARRRQWVARARPRGQRQSPRKPTDFSRSSWISCFGCGAELGELGITALGDGKRICPPLEPSYERYTERPLNRSPAYIEYRTGNFRGFLARFQDQTAPLDTPANGVRQEADGWVFSIPNDKAAFRGYDAP